MNSLITTAIIDARGTCEPDETGSDAFCRYLSPIANLPLITHVLDELASGGIERALIVSPAALHRRIASMSSELGRASPNVAFIDIADADSDDGLIPALRAAVDDRPVLVHPGDCLFPGRVSELRERFNSGVFDLVLLTCGPADSDHSGLRLVDGSARLRLPRKRPLGTAAIIGSALWPELQRADATGFEPGSLQQIVDDVTGAGGEVATVAAGSHWCFDGSVEALLTANRMVLDQLSPGQGSQPDDADNEVQGRVAVARGAQVSGSILRGPAAIASDAVIEDSFIGPYTAIGRGATVRGAEIENAMLLEEAQVLYPGRRLEASVIGERGMVSRSFALPTALRLHVGPDARVILD